MRHMRKHTPLIQRLWAWLLYDKCEWCDQRHKRINTKGLR
jgi:hypothetical protein